jgi:hypothetical protein
LLALGPGLLTALGVDVQHAVVDGELEILGGVDTGQLGPDHQRVALHGLLDADRQLGGHPAKGAERGEQLRPVQPLTERVASLSLFRTRPGVGVTIPSSPGADPAAEASQAEALGFDMVTVHRDVLNGRPPIA